jgi:polysaccharide export outer membrane protein
MLRPPLLISLLWVLLSACAHVAPESMPQLPVDASMLRETLGPGDVFEVRVFDEESLTGISRIEADGNFSYPLLGSVQAAGLTATELASLLQGRLADGYLIDPQVTVFVKEHNSRQVSVIGQVQKPGRYPYRIGMTLVEAIAEAGGTTESASLSSMRVTRLVEGKEVSADVPFKEITQGRMADFQLQAGDIVFVAESAIR